MLELEGGNYRQFVIIVVKRGNVRISCDTYLRKNVKRYLFHLCIFIVHYVWNFN